MPNGAIIYEGPSLLTGEPIFVAVTGLAGESRNPKTGPMAQSWILRSDMSPIQAVDEGADDAICGDCRMRGQIAEGRGHIGRACYVTYWHGPNRVFKGFKADEYPRLSPVALADVLRANRIPVRLGTYGDPAAVPLETWLPLVAATGHTGYTHQWQRCDPGLKAFLMASVDSAEEYQLATLMGWRTFRTRTAYDEAYDTEVTCPASAEAGHLTTCADCGLCRGLQTSAKNVVIVAHGQRMKWFKGDDLVARMEKETS